MVLVTGNKDRAHKFLWWAFGPPAMILCEPGQARKGAAAADDSCAGMWLEACHPNSSLFFTCFWLVEKFNCFFDSILNVHFHLLTFALWQVKCHINFITNM